MSDYESRFYDLLSENESLKHELKQAVKLFAVNKRQADQIKSRDCELDRLRAEYASLQESVTAKDLLIASLTEKCALLLSMHKKADDLLSKGLDSKALVQIRLNAVSAGAVKSLSKSRIVELTQQLAAVNSERDSWINEWKTSNKRCEELVGRIALQQEQLAAANGRVGEYREACEAALPYVEKAAKEHADDGYKHTPPIKALECIRAALTALPEADHSEHHLDMVADKEKS